MKLWIPLSLATCCLIFSAGCQSTTELYADRPVSNQVQLTGEYLPVEQVDQPPVATKQVPPEFPPVMRKARMDGTAFVVLVVNPSGQPEQVQVSTATHPLFAEAAVEAVKKWQFKPGMKAGQPVATMLSIPVQFRREIPTEF